MKDEEPEVTAQLGQKSAFDKWVLNLFVGGDVYSISITKKLWDSLYEKGLSTEG